MPHRNASYFRSTGISSRHLLRLIEDRGDVGFWSSNFETGEDTASIGLYRILGVHPSAPMSCQKLVALTHPDDRPRTQHMGQLVRSGQPFEREFRIVRPDGTLRWILNKAEVIFSEEGKPVHAVGLVQDVTWKYDAQLSLDQSEGRHDAILSALGAVVWTANAEGGAQPSQSWQTLTGQSAGEMIGDGWLKAIHPDDREQIRGAFANAVSQKTVYEAECRVRRADGTYRWIDVRGAPALRSDGTVVQWVGICVEAMPRVSDGSIIPSADDSQDKVEFDQQPTHAQIRGARGILGWSVGDLAAAAGVSVSTIRRIEDGEIESIRRTSLVRIRAALENAGIAFFFPARGKPGIRPR